METYHRQVVHERDFARLKSRAVPIWPVYVRDQQRIAGLVGLLTLALRMLVPCEQRLRAALAARGAQLSRPQRDYYETAYLAQVREDLAPQAWAADRNLSLERAVRLAQSYAPEEH